MEWGQGVDADGFLGLAVIWVTVIVAGIVVVTLILPHGRRHRLHVPHRGTAPREGRRRPPSPRELLDQRLATGDIDAETYRDLRMELATVGERPGDRKPRRRRG